MVNESNSLNAPDDLAKIKDANRGTILVCFALKQEAKAFEKLVAADRRVNVLITGIGAGNAQASLRNLLAKERPTLVVSAGFAGGLRSELSSGTVLFDVAKKTGLEAPLLAAGARPATFHCVDRIATTAEQKRRLRQSSKADAVEMESAILCEICRSEKIPAATIRVVLDTADEDLPLDFNRFMTSDQRMNYLGLAAALVRTPGKVAALLRLQKRSATAAEKLAQVLLKVLQKLSR